MHLSSLISFNSIPTYFVYFVYYWLLRKSLWIKGLLKNKCNVNAKSNKHINKHNKRWRIFERGWNIHPEGNWGLKHIFGVVSRTEAKTHCATLTPVCNFWSSADT